MNIDKLKDAKLTEKEKELINKEYDADIINVGSHEYKPEGLTQAEKDSMRRPTIVNNKIIISVRNRITDRTPNIHEYMEIGRAHV